MRRIKIIENAGNEVADFTMVSSLVSAGSSVTEDVTECYDKVFDYDKMSENLYVSAAAFKAFVAAMKESKAEAAKQGYFNEPPPASVLDTLGDFHEKIMGQDQVYRD